MHHCPDTLSKRPTGLSFIESGRSCAAAGRWLLVRASLMANLSEAASTVTASGRDPGSLAAGTVLGAFGWRLATGCGVSGPGPGAVSNSDRSTDAGARVNVRALARWRRTSFRFSDLRRRLHASAARPVPVWQYPATLSAALACSRRGWALCPAPPVTAPERIRRCHGPPGSP